MDEDEVLFRLCDLSDDVLLLSCGFLDWRALCNVKGTQGCNALDGFDVLYRLESKNEKIGGKNH